MSTTQQTRDKRKAQGLKSGLFDTIERTCDKIHFEKYDTDNELPPSDAELIALGFAIADILGYKVR